MWLKRDRVVGKYTSSNKNLRIHYSSDLRPRHIDENFHEACKDISNVGLEKCRLVDWSCHNLKYRCPHWPPQFPGENKFPGSSDDKDQWVATGGNNLRYIMRTSLVVKLLEKQKSLSGNDLKLFPNLFSIIL